MSGTQVPAAKEDKRAAAAEGEQKKGSGAATVGWSHRYEVVHCSRLTILQPGFGKPFGTTSSPAPLIWVPYQQGKGQNHLTIVD